MGADPDRRRVPLAQVGTNALYLQFCPALLRISCDTTAPRLLESQLAGANFVPTICNSNRTGVQLKDKWRNLVKFKHLSKAETACLASKTQRPAWKAE